MKNMLRWILFLVDDLMEEQFKDYDSVKLEFDFALWADGGKMYGGIKGLFSALKLVYPIFKNSDNEVISVQHEDIKWLIATSWMMSVSQGGETTENVHALEKFQIEEYISDVWEKEFCYSRFTMKVKLVGWCTDHGYRLKVVQKDSLDRCCGECDFSKEFCFIASYQSYHFLDMQYLLSIQEINYENWNTKRGCFPPAHFKMVQELKMSFLSYDNHHNTVGHIKKLFSILCAIILHHCYTSYYSTWLFA